MPPPSSFRGPGFSLHLQQKQELEQWLRLPGLAPQMVVRCLIVLAAAEGHSDSAIARDLKVNRRTVRLWRTRCATQGLAVLWEIAPGRGRKAIYSPNGIQSLVETARPTHPGGKTPWTCRELAVGLGMSKSTVSVVLARHNIPSFGKKDSGSWARHDAEKEGTAVIALYVNPPYKALLLYREGAGSDVDWRGLSKHEQSRQQDPEPIPGLGLLLSSVTGRGSISQRSGAFLRFLHGLDQEFPGSRPLHLFLEPLGTRKQGEFREWLRSHPRFRAHVAPPGCSLRRAVGYVWFVEPFDTHGAEALSKAIFTFVQSQNRQPFVWKAAE